MIPAHIKEALLHCLVSYSVDAEEGDAVVRLDFDTDEQARAFDLFEWLSNLGEDPLA